MSLNGQDSGSGRRSRTESFRSGTGSLRSRTESLSSLHSVGSSSNRFDTLSSGDMMVDEPDWDSEYSSFLSQDAFDDSSQDWAASSQDWAASSQDWAASRQDWAASRQDWASSRQDWAASSQDWTSCLSLNIDINTSLADEASPPDDASPPDEASPQNPVTITTSKPEEADQSDERWTVVGGRQKPRSMISDQLNKESRGELKCI